MTGIEGRARRLAGCHQPRSAAEIETLECRRLLSTWFVSPSGSDAAAGSFAAPWQTVQYALDHATSGDTITLRAGTYVGNVWVNSPNLTITSYVGENAIISSPYTDPNILVTVHVNIDANNTHLVNLEITGGNYYAVKTESTWDTGVPNPHGPSGLVLQNCRIHDTGADVVKLTPATTSVTISGCEIYNSGLMQPTNGEGVDGVQANYVTISDCYIHDIATNGIYLKGGSTNTLIERNRVYRCGYSGILLGQSTDPEWFNTQTDPNYYENIDGIVRNNIVVSTVGAGIGAWCALRPQIYCNTLYDVAQSWFGGLLIQAEEHWVPQDLVTPSRDVSMYDNIVVVKSGRPNLEIRDSGIAGTLTLGNNLYFNPTQPVLIRDLTRSFQGSLSAWQALGLDAASIEADPQLDAVNNYAPLAGSPAIDGGRIAPTNEDFGHNPRPAGAAYDIGAQEFQPGISVLPAPSNFQAVGQGPSSILLSWTNNSPSATGLTLQQSTDPTFTYDLTTIQLGPSTSSYTASNVISGATWYFRLQARTASAASAWAVSQAGAYPLPSVPLTPGTPSVVPGTGAALTITWTASPVNPYSYPATSYQIERAANSTFTSAVVRFTVPSFQLRYDDSQLIPNAVYYYRIRGMNSYGWSAPSGATMATSPGNTNTPPSISTPASGSPAIVTDSTTALSVLGSDNAGESALAYTWGIVTKPLTAADPTFTVNGSNLAKNTTVRFTSLGSYTLKVVIADSTGLTVTSTLTIQVVGVSVPIPQAPQNLAAGIVGSQQVNLTWTNPDSVATSLTLQQSTSPDFQYDLVTTQLPTGTAGYSATALLSNVTYYFRIRANGVRLNSAWAQASAKIPASAQTPNTPTNFAITSASSTGVTLKWNASVVTGSNAPTAYYIERSPSPTFTSNIWRINAGTATTYTDTTVSSGQTWYYRILAVDAYGWSDPTAPATAILA